MPSGRQHNGYAEHSEEAQQILGRVPSWIVRWGVTVISAVFALILIGCCIIRYPERVTATVTITTGNSPVDVVAGGGGNLERILVSSGDSVSAGGILGVIRSSARWEDVLEVERRLKETAGMPPDSLASQDWVYAGWGMGDIQSEWSAFSTACRQLREYLERDAVGRRMELVREQIAKQSEYYARMQVQAELMEEDLALEMKDFRRDSLLFMEKIIPSVEFEQATRDLLSVRRERESFRSQMTSTELAVLQLEQQLAELSIQRDDEILSMERELDGCRERLEAQIRAWSLACILASPMDGAVSFVRKWDSGQFIGAGESFVTVVPSVERSPVGIVKVPQASFGKVSTGQKVNVRLNGYPYMEYGLLVGEIGYLSSVPEAAADPQTEPQYTAEIVFPDGMVTTYGRELRLIQKMDGTAEIITKDRRLIMRFLDPIAALFKNGI